MRRIRLLALPLLLALAASASAGDLSGLWAVSGTLPDGAEFEGLATVSPQATDGRYFLNVRGRDGDGEGVRWRATGIRSGDVLKARHWRNQRGLAGRIGALAGPKRVVAEYAIGAEERTLAGEVAPEDSDRRGALAWARRPDPTAAFAPGAVTIQAGRPEAVTLTVDPPGALGLVALDGVERHELAYATGEAGRLELDGRTPGRYVVEARLGRGGAVLAELQVDVRSDVLEEVARRVAELVAAGEAPVVVFDLDDTLFESAPRSLELLRRWGREHDEPRLAGLEPGDMAYMLDDTLENAGLSAEEIGGPLGDRIEAWWEARFFGGEHYHLDGLVPGAVAYVNRLADAGARVVYVTGRTEDGREGSLEALRAAGYPTEDVPFFLKPEEPYMKTAVFKGRVARDELPQLGVPVAAFDNEPGNCNAFLRNLPGAVVVFMQTMHKPWAPELEEGIPGIPHFEAGETPGGH